MVKKNTLKEQKEGEKTQIKYLKKNMEKIIKLF